MSFGNDKNLTNRGSGTTDFFVVKYNSSGVAQWTQGAASGSGLNGDWANDVAVDTGGNVYVAGYYGSATLSFGNDKNLTNQGSYDFYVVKYNSSGTAQWAQGPASGSGTNSDYINSVFVDTSSNVYVACESNSSSLSFGNDKNLTSRSPGFMDFCVAKYNSGGTAQWAQNPASGSGASNDYGQSVFVDSGGNIYVAGRFTSSTLSFGGASNDVNLTNRGSTDFFVVKYNSSGVAQWAKNPVSGGGATIEYAYGVVVDSSSNVYVAGYFSSTTLGFGGAGNDVNLTNRGSDDFYIVKYDSSGVAGWAQNPVNGSGTGSDPAYGVAVDSSGNVYVAGYFSSTTLGFGDDYNLTNRGSDDFFVVKGSYS